MILTIVGARPNFVKAAPIHAAFERRGVPHAIVHTGQHHDDAMSRIFFKELGMPAPIADFGVGAGSHAEQTGAVMVGLERFFSSGRPRAVLVVGDVNSTLAASLVAAKMGIYLVHVEAGLRSGDWSMPEEINRVVTDAVADLLLTPSPDADKNLLAEGCAPDSIVHVGNVMVDTLVAHLPRAQALAVHTRFGFEPAAYGVVTLHRPGNVDDPETLRTLLRALTGVAAKVPLVFPVHPRTRRRIEDMGYSPEHGSGLVLSDPLGYLDFLSLVCRAQIVLTDSGGLQEESTALGVPCLTLRTNTERPVTVEEGTNVLVGTDPDAIARQANRVFAQPHGAPHRVPALWDGRAAERIVDAVMARVGP